MNQQDRPFWDYFDLLLLAVAFVPALLAAGVLVAFAFGGSETGLAGRAPQLLAGQFLAYVFWFSFLYLLLRVRYDRPFWRSLGWVGFMDRFWGRLFLGVGLAVGVALLGGLLRTPDLDTPMKQLLSDRLSVMLIGLAAVTIGPVCEELAFRGFVQPLLVRTLGVVPGIVLTALPFALLHGPGYAWSWRHVLLITVAGVSFGWMRHKTGSTAAATVMHAGYNATFFTALLVAGKDLPA